MALQHPHSFAGITIPGAYHRIDRIVIEHKQSIYIVVTTYADAARAAAKDALPIQRTWALSWPVAAVDPAVAVPVLAPIAIVNPAAFAYAELLKLNDFTGAKSV